MQPSVEIRLRWARVFELVLRGASQTEAAASVGLSRERGRQIVIKFQRAFKREFNEPFVQGRHIDEIRANADHWISMLERWREIHCQPNRSEI